LIVYQRGVQELEDELAPYAMKGLVQQSA